MPEWLESWKWLLALPLATLFGGFLVYVRLKWRGSRRSRRNWGKNAEISGDPNLLLLGSRFVKLDTMSTEGHAKSIYYTCHTGYVYEVVAGVRLRFLRSYVVVRDAVYEWPTERGRGMNIIRYEVSHPYPCTGLEPRTDANGTPYAVIVPVADKLCPETEEQASS